MDDPLKVGVDLRLCDLWGIDCHTRTVIWTAVHKFTYYLPFFNYD
jgi:hypothetical protein